MAAAAAAAAVAAAAAAAADAPMEQAQEGQHEVGGCVGTDCTDTTGAGRTEVTYLCHHPTRPTNGTTKQVVVNFRHITEMENHGVNRTDLNKLMEAGYCTVESVRGWRIA